MKNLAGVETCDVDILAELNSAGIMPIKISRVVDQEKLRGEVPTKYFGVFNGFVFTRAWYYWCVNGNMPLEVAQKMYLYNKDLSIRVAGHCGNPPPEEWCEPADYQEKLHELWNSKDKEEKIDFDAIEAKAKEFRAQGEQFVVSYHIDTQEGLNKFIEYVKFYNVMG